jgi:subtilisin family serine protease
MPRSDDESSDWTANGTSLAAAQVAGAAALFRAVKPAASSLQVKAALLASAEEVAAMNPGLDRNAFGMGYLRDDFLLTFGLGRGTLFSGTVDGQQRSHTIQVPVVAGRR